MAAQNIIELGFNIEELTAEKKQVLDLFVDMFGQLSKYDGTRFNPLEGGLADLKKSIVDGGQALNAYTQSAQKYNDVVTEQAKRQAGAKQGTTELSAAIQAHQRILDQLAATQAKNNALDSDAAEGLAAERQALKERNSELANAAKLQLAVSGSINEATAKVDQLKAARNDLDLTTEEGTQKQAEFNQQINELNAFIKENVSVLEQTKINIGNYSGSLSSAFDSSREQLVLINKQLAEMEVRGKAAFTTLNAGQQIGFDADRHKGSNNVTGQSAGGVTGLAGGSGNQVIILNEESEAYQKLTLQGKVLEGSLERQAIGFKTAGQEMRNVKTTLDTMTLSGLGNTEAFEKLSDAYADNEQRLKDLHHEQAILTTDVPALTALTGIARGLGGAYAFGAGAAQLFASGNEKLDKELNKLVAIMTLLQGLEEAVTTLKEKNAIATALQTEATKALNLVRQVETAIFGATAAAVATDTVAVDINTESQIANTEGLETNAAGAVLNAEAVGAVTVANEAATVATIGFRTALVSTGIGAIIITLIYGITKLVGAISDWASTNERAEATEKALTASTSELLDTAKQLSDVYQIYSKEHIEDLTKQNELTKSAGANQFILLENERQVNQARLDMAKKLVDQKKIDQATVDSLNDKQKVALETLQGLETLLAQVQYANGIGNTKEGKKFEEDLRAKVDAEKAATKNIVTEYALQYNALKAQTDAEQALRDNQVQTAKAAADQMAKLTADANQRQFDTTQAHNEHILGSATSSQSDRLGAVQGNYQAESDLGDSQIAALKKQNDAKIITNQDYADQVATIQSNLAIKYKKSLDDQLKIRVEFNDRMLDAENAIYKNDNGSDAAKQDAITKDTQRQLEVRLQALQQYINDRTSIINNDYRTELAKAAEKNTTDAEYAAMDSNRQKELLELTDDVQKQIYDITISWGEKRVKAIEEQNKATNSANGVTTNYNAAEQQLNEHLSKNILSYFTYEGNRKKLDEQYAIDKTAADIKDDQAALARLKDFQANEVQIRLDAANADLDTAKSGGNTDDIANAQSKVDALKKIQTEGAVDIAAAVKKLGDDTSKNQDATAKAAMDKVQTTIQAIKELSTTAAQTMVGLFDAAKDKQIQSIELVTARQDAATDATIADVQRSTMGQRQASEEVIILSAQKEARDSAAQKKTAEDKRAEAVAERDMAIATTIWNTEAAVAKTLAEFGGTPLGFAAAAVVAALGAVEVATIMSKPIPSYAEGIGIPGRGEHPGGAAIVGEAGPELVTMPGHEPFVADQAMLLDMPRGSVVDPLNRNLIADLGGVSMQRAYEMTGWTPDRSVEIAINNQTSAINNQTAQLVKAFKKNQRNITKVIVNSNPLSNPNDPFTIKILGRRK